MESHNRSSIVVVVAAIDGIVIGGLGGYYISDMNMDKDSDSMNMSQSVSEKSPNSMTKAADLRVTLNQMMRQHVALATVALKDSASGTPDAGSAVKALDANSVELSKAIGSVYGEQAEKDFLALWRKHIGFFVDYTTAKVAGDEAKMTEAKANLEGYTEDASTFFKTANPEHVDKEALKKGLATHANQVVQIVDSYAAGDYDAASAAEEEAYNHIGMAADTLSNGIVMQFPDKF